MPKRLKYLQPALPKEWEAMLDDLLENKTIRREIRLRGWSLTPTSVVKLGVWKLLEDRKRNDADKPSGTDSTQPR